MVESDADIPKQTKPLTLSFILPPVQKPKISTLLINLI